MSRLRSILRENNVSFPAGAKKKELVHLLEKHILHPKKQSEIKVPLIDASGAENPETKSNEKKRKSKAKSKKTDKTPPPKGNVFEVDSDSESDILSPRKRTKLSPQVTSLEKNKESKRKHTRETKAESKVQESMDSVKATRTKTPKDIDEESEEESGETSNAEEESNESATPGDGSRAPTKSNKEQKMKSPFSPEASSASSGESEDNSHSITIDDSERIDATQDSLKADNTNSFVDAAQEFDSSLRKLKSKKNSDKAFSEERDVELAKLLGVDIGGVKPKKNGRRIITPRRPIIIHGKRLSSQEVLHLPNEVESGTINADASSDDQSLEGSLSDEMNAKTETEFDNEDEDELDEDFDLEVNKNTMTASDFDDESDSSTRINRHKRKSSRKQKAKPHISMQSFFKSVSYLLVWIAVLGASLFGYWYREQTFLVGYCGQEIFKPTIPSTPQTPKLLVNFGAYLDKNFRPQCVKCPQHARCFSNLNIGCYDDFVEYAPWYFPYVPMIDPTLKRCVPNTKKAEKIEIMIDVALDLLRARNANKNCGNTLDRDFEAGLSTTDLHDILLSLKAPYITEEEFEELWARCVVELEAKPEIIVRQVPFNFSSSTKTHTNKRQVGSRAHHDLSRIDTNNTVGTTQTKDKVLRSTSLSHISLRCQMSNTATGILLRFKRFLLAVVIATTAAFYARYKYQKMQYHAQQVETVYKEVLSKLQRQAKLAAETSELPPYIGSIQLRDLILSHESNLARKMRLWEAVSRKVDRNSNVRHQLLEIHGDVMKVWEWVSVLD